MLYKVNHFHIVYPTKQDDYDDDARTDNSSRSWDESASFVRGECCGGGEGEGGERFCKGLCRYYGVSFSVLHVYRVIVVIGEIKEGRDFVMGCVDIVM